MKNLVIFPGYSRFPVKLIYCIAFGLSFFSIHYLTSIDIYNNFLEILMDNILIKIDGMVYGKNIIHRIFINCWVNFCLVLYINTYFFPILQKYVSLWGFNYLMWSIFAINLQIENSFIWKVCPPCKNLCLCMTHSKIFDTCGSRLIGW